MDALEKCGRCDRLTGERIEAARAAGDIIWWVAISLGGLMLVALIHSIVLLGLAFGVLATGWRFELKRMGV